MNSDQLYQTAKALLGRNLAPGNERLGCAISLSAVYNLAFPAAEPLRFVNTTQWYDWLKKNPDWEQIEQPESDCLIVSVTGKIPKGSPIANGHIGIIGRKPAEDGSLYVMSNNSYLGYWDTHLTLQKWTDYFITYGRVPTFYFRLKSD